MTGSAQKVLSEDFYHRETLIVARELLGMRLVRMDHGQRISGRIVETEAYCGEEDQGCHCKAGRTPRTQVMYGPPGRAYVYFIYGMHWLLNFVTEPVGQPGAVLIRGLLPEEGQQLIAARRKGQPEHRWMDGPAKICQALAIDGALNGQEVCRGDGELFVERTPPPETRRIHTTPRIGLDSVPEPWKSIPWRFLLKGQGN